MANVKNINLNGSELNITIDEKITKGTPVDLSETTENNKFSVPADGYMQIGTGTASTGIVCGWVCDKNGEIICGLAINSQTSGTYNTQSIFVKKGMKLYLNAPVSGSAISYIPLV